MNNKPDLLLTQRNKELQKSTTYVSCKTVCTYILMHTQRQEHTEMYLHTFNLNSSQNKAIEDKSNDLSVF